MEQELKPCPFCGGGPELKQRFDQVVCAECSARSRAYDEHPEDAICAWNSRPLEDTLKAKLAEAARMANGIRESVGLLWRPIETAPKDGSEILAHRHDCGVLIASWREPAEFMTDDEIESSDLPADELYSPCWFAFGSWGVSQIGDGDLFTNWMPLPEPPAILNDAREGGEG